MNDTDDFWGDVPDWDDRPGRSRRRSDRPADGIANGGPASVVDGIGSTLRSWWDRALGGEADATRTHGIPRPDLSHQLGGHDQQDGGDELDGFEELGQWDEFDEFDRLGVADRRADRDPVPASATTHRSSARSQHDEAPYHDLDDAFAVERPERGRDGIDPLILRIGAAVVAVTLLLPFVFGRGDSTDTITGAPASDVEATDTSTVPLAPSSAPAPDTGGTPPPASGTLLDPATLPPAIPVNDLDDDTATTNPDDDAAPTTADGDDPGTADAPGSGDPDNGDTGGGDSGDTDPGDGDSGDGDGTAGASTGAVTGSATADSAANREERDCAIDYEVVAGDFWLRLAEESGVPLAELLDANAATTSTPLFPGSTICLPAGARTPDPPAATTTTTAAPTTTSTTTTTVPVPDVPRTAEEIQQLIRDIWPDDLEDRAIEIAYRESRFDPRAKNFCCYGIFQIYWSVHRSWLADLGITSDQQLYDPETNIRAAFALYERAGGWGPWGF